MSRTYFLMPFRMLTALMVVSMMPICAARVHAKQEQTPPKPVGPTLSTYTGPKKRLGVMDIELKVTATQTVTATPTSTTSTTAIEIPPPTDFSTGMTEMLTTSLIDSGRFVVLERKYLSDIQAEQTLQAGGTVDPTSMAAAGKLLGAQQLIRGAITSYSYKRSSTGGTASFLQGIGLSMASLDASVGLDIRIYDVATGQILDSVTADGHAKAKATGINIDKGGVQMSSSSFSQTPLGEATREAINKAVVFICKRMDTIPWEGRIAEVDEGSPPTLYINAGNTMGLKVGDCLEVFRAGKSIIDPETRVVIGRTKDTVIGKCRIDTAQKDISLASPTQGQGFASGDYVRMIGLPPPSNVTVQPN